MPKKFEHPNPRSRKPNEFKGTWKGRIYRRGIVRALSVNFLVFLAIFAISVYVVQFREQTKQTPRVWTLGSN